ncbi:hypothetical protein Emag_003095 [Eimeria magna]
MLEKSEGSGFFRPLSPPLCTASFKRLPHNDSLPNPLRSPLPPRVWRVVLVGRANVGKSSLYNRFITSTSSERDTSQQLAIVGSEPGTTRDRKESACSWGGLNLIVSDTVGVDAQFHMNEDAPIQQVDEQLTWAIQSCDLILLVVDAAEGITSVDELLARRLVYLLKEENQSGGRLEEKTEEEGNVNDEHQPSPPPIILIINKSEGSAAASCLADAYELQLGHPELVSAKTTQHGPQSISTHQRAATEAWLEGLARRYGRGVRPSLAHMQVTNDVLLPWSLEKKQIINSQQEESQMIEEEAQANAKNEMEATKEDDDKEEQEPLVDMHEAKEDLEIKEEVAESSDEKREGSNGEGFNEQPIIRVTFIGRPNAGKSSLINSILKDDRLSVSEVPGTTTDSVRLDFTFKKQQFTLTDTAGVCRGWRMRGDDLLQHASMQTLRNICQADVCVLCLDASRIEDRGHISSNDLSLANLASEREGRCLVVCVTKWDLVEPKKQASLRSLILERVRTGIGHLKSCPVVFTSATQAHNLDVLMNKIRLLFNQWGSRVPTPLLNAWLLEYTARWPPPWRLGSQCQVKYITQARISPPTFVAWSNVYAHFPLHYKRQLINAIREQFNMKGVPVRLILRTTAMPKPGAKLTKEEVLKWKRLGPHQRYLLG